LNNLAFKNELQLPKPFVKWAGGKRQLIELLLENTPESFNTFYEPFVGGGALFFALMPSKAIISDINSELINAYDVSKNNVEELISCLKKHRNEEEYFYAERALSPKNLSAVRRASRFIFLNKTCYNGLYRENSKGQFNAPFGRYKNPRIVDEDNLRAVSCYLNSADIRILNHDYKSSLSNAAKGDFIYLDPPYHPFSETASFTKYSKGDFTVKDQEELADVFKFLDKKGVFVMLSNSNTEVIKKLYRNYDFSVVEASRSINCKAQKRGKGFFEVLIKNW